MKVKEVVKKFSVVVMSAAILVSSLNIGLIASATSEKIGMGDINFSWSREIYNDVSLSHIMSENESGIQKAYTTEFNPTTCEVKPVLNYGDYVMGGDIMSDMISQVEQNGDKVVFAINGDAYDTSNGVSNGLMIKNGLLISTSNGSEAVGFKQDGTVIYGSTNLNIKATTGDTTIPIAHVNKERKLDTSNVYLLTEQFDKATRSTQPGVEVVLNVTTDGYQGVQIGKSITATVESVNQVAANPDKNNTPIGKGQIVLSVHSDSSQYATLSGLSKGQELTIDVQNNNADVDWSQAQQALGIFHVLMKDGVINESALSDTAVHPRTVFGTKADGTVVLFQCDGRQPGFADGMTFTEIVDYMKSLDCVNIFNFDGGGSSTIAVTLPGDEEATILNRPSDGNERANCNALLFVATSEPVEGNPVQKLHVYPDTTEGYGTKTLLLENGKLGFRVGATDNNYHYTTVDPENLVYTTEGDIGTIEQDGVLTAASGTHEGKVIVSTKDGSAKGEIEVSTVDSITKLTADRSILSVAPSGTTQLSFTAEYNGIPVELTSEALSFELSDSSLGSIQSDGTFIAADTQGTGELRVSYKDYSLVIPVEIGKLPVLLNDFEQPLEETGWMWRYTNPQNGGSGKMSINYDERFVRTGDGSLRIDYDFATKPVTGTIAIEAGPKDTFYLEGQPKAIGCWVYGDGNGAWLRIQLAPAAYVGDTYVDWVGWKYIETEIPSTASFPYQLVYGVRLLCTPTTPVQNKKGTIYVDGLRAVYDFKNDDTKAPELVPGTEVTPADGATNVGHQPDISMTVYDPAAEGEPYTGINTERTKLWINGKVMDNVLHEVQPDGSVKINYIPSALTSLRSGLNKIKYRVEDNAGNKFFKEWSFTVEGYNVNLEEIKPEGEKASAGSTFDYIINANDYKNFEQFDLDLSYNPEYVTLVSATPDSRVTVQNQEIDEETGSIKYTLTGMKDLAKDENNPLVKLRFQVQQNAGGLTGITVNKAVVRETGEVEGTDLVLEGYDKEIAFKYTLSWNGSTVGGQTTLTVKDSEGNPVPNIGFQVTKDGQEVALEGVTNENGQLETSLFGSYPAGSNFEVWVKDQDGALSNRVEIPVFESLGSPDPSKIVVTTGEDPSTSVGISWETSLDITQGNIVIGKQSDLSDGRTIAATNKTILTTLNSYDRNYQAWDVSVNDLEPDTTYYYKVGQGEHYSEVKSFTTTPAAGNDVTIGFYGDIQGAYNRFPDAIESLKSLYPDIDMSLIAGDVSDNGHIYTDWSSIDSNFGSYLSSGIWAATIGNHDSYFDAQTFTSFFNGPSNGTYSTPRNYWFTVGDMVIYNLDTEAVYSYDPDFSGQIAKMKEVFNNSDKTYKVVLMHRSSYPLNYDEADVRELHTTFDELGVDLVLSGHDHIYSRTEMYNGEKVTDGQQGTMYIVGGCSSGSKFYDADSNGRPWQDVVYDENNPVFSVLKQRDGKLYFEAYAMENGETKMIDSVEIQSHSLKQVDKTILNSVIDYAEDAADSPEFDNVIADVQKSFTLALENAKAVAADDTAVQTEVDAAWQALLTEIHKLGFVKGDITSLETLVKLAETYDMNDFVEAGQKEFQDALNAAQAIIADKDNAMAGEIETAETNLLNAMLNLRYKADKSILEKVISEANEVDASTYTAESYAVLTAAVAEANAVMKNENATQKEVDTAVQSVQTALDGLVAVDGTASEETISSTDDVAIQTGQKSTTTKSKAAKTGDVTPIAGAAALVVAGVAVLLLQKKK
ncbi:phosphodiester glycosidase family protein [Clostridium facile]|uniref:Phosphodiester glycosidase family protein n=1 Tax=Clostridium facile TaxID=2763035 RepID=A0ABR7ITT5_9CLOT|nr:phosphodiester glycosidase family protein [Clostridium facile]MBC5788550.1 phosphodiester glycosidase family protein [Clostridium facile]